MHYLGFTKHVSANSHLVGDKLEMNLRLCEHRGFRMAAVFRFCCRPSGLRRRGSCRRLSGTPWGWSPWSETLCGSSPASSFESNTWIRCPVCAAELVRRRIWSLNEKLLCSTFAKKQLIKTKVIKSHKEVRPNKF